MILRDTPLETLTISRHRFVSPATLFDVEHLFAAATGGRFPTTQLPKPQAHSIRSARGQVRQFFRA